MTFSLTLCAQTVFLVVSMIFIWRKQLAHQQILVLGILSFFSGNGGDDLAKTLSRCLDSGRELITDKFIAGSVLEKNLGAGFGFS